MRAAQRSPANENVNSRFSEVKEDGLLVAGRGLIRSEINDVARVLHRWLLSLRPFRLP